MRQYLDLVQRIKTHGRYKSDRTGTGTISVVGEQMRFKMSDGFPLLTTKRIHLKSIVHELLWFLSGDTNVKYLQDNGVTIWGAWSTKEQCAKYGRLAGDLGPIYGHQWRNFGATQLPDGSYLPDGVDQIQKAIDTIKNNPDSRRNIVSGWNAKEVDAVALPPCHSWFQFHTYELPFEKRLALLNAKFPKSITKFMDLIGAGVAAQNEYLDAHDIPRRALTCQLYCRSQDIFLGTPFNIASYALLLSMIAQVTNTVADELIWIGGDCHLYSNHMEQVDELLSREPLSLCTLHLNPAITNIFDFTYDDITVSDYQHHPAIKAPVAV